MIEMYDPAAATHLFLGCKSSNKDKSGTGAVNAFKIYYTRFKINPYKLTNLVRGQLEHSFDLQIKFGVEFC